MNILTDELRSNLKVQTVSKRQVLGNAVLYSFIDESAAVRPTESAVSLPLTAQNRRRERQHCAGRVRPHARGAVLATSSN